jgi:hypothetical protein
VRVPHLQEDYSRLPKPTTDMATAKRDMDLYGYCILQNMLPPERLARLLDRLTAQAEHDGVDPAKPDPRSVSILASMQNKGSEYVELLEDPKVLEVVGHVVGEHFHFQILNQAWHTGGKTAAPLHTDQWWFPPPTRHDRPVRVPTGSISRPGAYDSTWHPEPPYENFISPSVRCTAIWMATDFTPDNGDKCTYIRLRLNLKYQKTCVELTNAVLCYVWQALHASCLGRI